MESSSQSGTVYHGNVGSRISHGPSCRYFNCKNCVKLFGSKQDAEKAPGIEGAKSRPVREPMWD